MVTMAPRVSPPEEGTGLTISPTSASFRSTAPPKGARTKVLSKSTWADCTRALAFFTAASALFTRARATSSAAIARSSSAWLTSPLA